MATAMGIFRRVCRALFIFPWDMCGECEGEDFCEECGMAMRFF